MIQGTSRRIRVVVARLGRGEWLHEALLELAKWERIDCATVRGQGALELAEIGRWDQEARAPGPSRTLEGALELVSLSGNVSLEAGRPVLSLHAGVAAPAPDGAAGGVVAGRLLRARAFAVELAVEAYDDLEYERVRDPETGLALWRHPRSK